MGIAAHHEVGGFRAWLALIDRQTKNLGWSGLSFQFPNLFSEFSKGFAFFGFLEFLEFLENQWPIKALAGSLVLGCHALDDCVF
jgi:hypothetical protein